MSANTIITSVVTGGTNNHTTVAEEANSLATDFVTQGVVGAITVGSGSTAGTGSFAVTQDATPDMGVTILSGQAYITATPSSQDSQVLRARASADYTAYTINANSSGSTKYDWIYLSVSATNANAPDAAADNVTSIYTSRSSSNTTDNGTPPTYGLLLAIVTVANGASSITNSNITDKRFNTSIGAQNGSLIVTQQATGDDAIIQAAGTDANINLNLEPKGTGILKSTAKVATLNSNPVWQYLGYAQITTSFTTTNTSATQITGISATVTIPTGATKVKVTVFSYFASHSVQYDYSVITLWNGTVGSGTQIGQWDSQAVNGGGGAACSLVSITTTSAGSVTFNAAINVAGAGTGTFSGSSTAPAYILVECC